MSLISLSDHSLLVYRNVRFFCVLVLCLTASLNSLISSSDFLVDRKDFLCIVSCHLQIVTVLLLFQFGFLFFFFFSLIALARTFKTILSNSSESGHLCLIPDFRVNAFKFSPLRIMCCRF